MRTRLITLSLFALMTLFAAGVTMAAGPQDGQEGEGYLLYCPCMGRLGNQVAQLVGTLEVARASGRTLVLAPFIDYKRSGTTFIPFDQVFSVEAVRELVPAVTMEEFLNDPDLAAEWPASKRRLYCSSRAAVSGTASDPPAPRCRMPSGNPHKTFWDHFGIEFVDSVAAGESSADLVRQLSASEESVARHPVIALGSSPGSFPVAAENRHLQHYLLWSDEHRQRAEAFISEHLPRPFLAVHLRNGDDWKSACQRGLDRGAAYLMSSPQCGLAKPEPGAAEPGPEITEEICLPDPAEAIRGIQAAEERFGPFRAVFIGTDRHDYREDIQAAVGADVRVVRGDTPILDLTVFAQADLFIGNCVSSFTALAVRERLAAGRPSVFFGFGEWTEHNAYLDVGIATDDK